MLTEVSDGNTNGGEEGRRGTELTSGVNGGHAASTDSTALDLASAHAEEALQSDATAVVSTNVAFKRKRGRPKGSKNKAKVNDAEPRQKRARPAVSKTPPKRCLTQALVDAQDSTFAIVEPCLVAAPSTLRETSVGASANVPSEYNACVPPKATTVPNLVTSTEVAGEVTPVQGLTTKAAVQDSDAPEVALGGGTTVQDLATLTEVGAEVAATQDLALPVAASTGTPRRNPARPPLIPALYVNTLVAFSPAKEGWTKRQKAKDKYPGVGNAYLVGRVCRIIKGAMFLVQWLDSQYQGKAEHLNLSMIQRGNANYRSLHRNSSIVGWSHLCAPDVGESIQVDGDSDQMEECMELFDPPMEPPTTLAEVEAIKNMRFDPEKQSEEPADLFCHADGTTTTRLLPEFRHLFEHSASASFFAYIPVSFWQQVVGETNSYARVHGIALSKPFTLDEIMTFLGVLFYMELVDRGEYSNYWGKQVEDSIFGGSSVSLDAVMPLSRFKKLRNAFCFQNMEVANNTRDQAARIRPLLNLLKVTGPKYVAVGRNVALDEASVACRSKYGKPLIVYNPMKPTGKYHFRIYMLCCSTTWISLNFRLHCQSDMTERLAGVTTQVEAQALSDELGVSSSIRQCVLEVVRPLYGSGRIVNSDNYYTSVQLLDALRLKGLYGRGTVRKSSAHFPKHVVLEKKDCTRGTSRQGVSADRNTIAASWYDSSIVTVISNADPSTLTTVVRQVRSEKQTIRAPTCIKEYNANMQGVDRLDQVRSRFSLADGHSFKKWFKKLGLALVDVARSNAYFTRKLALGMDNKRDSHRDFIIQLSSELISGKWKEAPSERLMFYNDLHSLDAAELVDEAISPSSAVWVSSKRGTDEDGGFGSPQKRCSAVSSKQLFPDANRKRRQCVVCRWEDRYATEVTDFCVLHSVCLCQHVYETSKPYMCPKQTWTCWEKYHRFYLHQKLFSSKGKVRTSSRLYKLKQASVEQRNSEPGPEVTGGPSSVVRSINL